LLLKDSCIKDLPKLKERAYLGLQHKPGFILFGQAFVEILPWEYEVVAGGILDISKVMGGNLAISKDMGGLS
jgi:hypothetical protein